MNLFSKENLQESFQNFFFRTCPALILGQDPPNLGLVDCLSQLSLGWGHLGLGLGCKVLGCIQVGLIVGQSRALCRVTGEWPLVP